MIWIDFLLILFLSALLAGALGAAGWRRPGTESPWGGLALLMGLLFLALWAGRLWVVPAGPLLWGVAWLPLFTFGLVFALLLALAMPPPRRRRRPSGKSDVVIEEQAGPADVLASLVLWVILLALVASIAAGYA